MSLSYTLLSVVERGGYPDFTEVYRQAGYSVVTVKSVRKALVLLKSVVPDIVVAEFNYSPTYGARISSLESLLAAIQSRYPDARLIVFAERDEHEHLERLRPRFPKFTALFYPIEVERLRRALEQVIS
jgi:DNA-binding NtrC family response regulator